MDKFQELWKQQTQEKGIICAGLDPKNEKEYIKGEALVDWGIGYIEAISSYISALKPNPKFWRADKNSSKYLKEILEYTKQAHKNILIIYDEKFSDIGSTNKNGISSTTHLPIDAVTLSQFPGNMTQSVEYCKESNLGSFPMCLMSNPEFKQVKNGLYLLKENEKNNFREQDLIIVQDNIYVKNYTKWAKEASESQATEVVIGATGHITEEEIKNAAHYLDKNQLILSPGIGKQGGSLDSLKKAGINLERIIVNIGTGLMYPNGPNSTMTQQEQAVKQYYDMIENSEIYSNYN